MEGEINTDAGVIATIPFHSDDGLMVANSVGRVDRNRVPILIMNVDTWHVKIMEKQLISAYENLEDPSKIDKPIWGVNNILPLGDTSSFVNVGTNLSDAQIMDLECLLKANMEAFSTDGKIGFTRKIEHKITLLPGTEPFREKG